MLQRAGATSAKQSTGFFVKGHIVVRRSDTYADANGGNMLKWARIITTPLELLEKPSTEGLLLSGRPVSMECEMAALRLLVTKMAAWIGAAPTTYAEDEALLTEEGSTMSGAMNMAVSFRREGKLLANELLMVYGKRKRSVMLVQREIAKNAKAKEAKDAKAKAEAAAAGEESA